MAFCAAANAQEVTLPQKGDFAVELGFNPFSNNFETFRLDGSMVRGRYFVSNHDALKLGIAFQFTLVNGEYDGDYHATNFGAAIGYERHWFTSKKIDLYGGPSLGLSLRHNAGPNYHGGTQIDDPDHYTIGVELGTGINYYLVRGLYLGAELGLQYNHLFFCDYVQDGTKYINRENAINISFAVRPSLVIGWTF